MAAFVIGYTDDMRYDFRKLLRRRMNVNGFNQTEVAKRAGVSRPSLNQFLAGKRDFYTDTYARVYAAADQRARRKQTSAHPFG